MNQTSMLLLGVVKLTNPTTKETRMVEIKGFDVLGFFFPFIRLLIDGHFVKALLFICTFYVYPIWCWYIGFNSRKMKFDKMIKDGWVIEEEKHQQVQAA